MSGIINIVIKPTGQSGDKPDRFTVMLQSDATILQLKEEVAKHCELVAEQQRLIYKGQIMKDHQTVADYGMAVPIELCLPFPKLLVFTATPGLCRYRRPTCRPYGARASTS